MKSSSSVSRTRPSVLARTSTSSSRMLAEAVKSYLERPGSLAELFEGIDQGQHERGVAPLSEAEAMRLAIEEQHAWKRERRSIG